MTLNPAYFKYLFLIGAAILCCFIARFLIRKKHSGSRSAKVINYGGNQKNHFYFFYRLFSVTPILRTYQKQIQAQIESLYPADYLAVTKKTTLYMLTGTGSALACFAAIIFVSRGDWFFLGAGILFVYVLITHTASNSLEKLEFKILEQFRDFLTDISQQYTNCGIIEDAIYATLDDLPYEIGIHISRIYEILNSTRVESEVAKYADIAPNRFLLTFASISASIKEYGDKKLRDGRSLFLTNINYLEEEVNTEILRRKDKHFLFSGFAFVSVAPVVFVKPLESWIKKNMTDLSPFLEGSGGIIAMASVLITAFAIYQMIETLKDGHRNSLRENKLLRRISEIPVIERILNMEINRNYTKNVRIADNLKLTGDQTGPKGFLLKRVLTGILLVIVLNTVIVISQTRMKDNLIHDFTSAYSDSIVPSEEYRVRMRDLSAVYAQDNLAYIKQEPKELREQLSSQIQEKEGMKNTYADMIAKNIVERYQSFRNVYYRWYFILLNILAAVIGFYLPYWMLLYRIQVLQMDQEDEVVQFQTLALILMHVDGVTIDVLLEWMERFAYCFKTSVSECIISLENGEAKALQRMKESERFPPFRRFVDNLLNIDNVGMEGAFAEIESERSFYQKKREQDNNILMKKKSSLCGILCFIPGLVFLAAYIIIPFALLYMRTQQNYFLG